MSSDWDASHRHTGCIHCRSSRTHMPSDGYPPVLRKHRRVIVRHQDVAVINPQGRACHAYTQMELPVPVHHRQDATSSCFQFSQRCQGGLPMPLRLPGCEPHCLEADQECLSSANHVLRNTLIGHLHQVGFLPVAYVCQAFPLMSYSSSALARRCAASFASTLRLYWHFA